ncbi:MAG TPA: L-2-hydroxyglutarate oxidase [Candidatus Kapabacteria bacterium]|nr:L-2-hydroxyglutarate oxidase [Candidatus Kapabacteria bacterium]
MSEESKLYDIAIIGGGIVGLATAMEMSHGKKISIIVIEAENRLAAHQTGNNSGVVHSGLYYKPGSLKAINCAKGRELLYEFCQIHDIPHERCGKVVVAVSKDEIANLEKLHERGIANGLQGIKRLDAEEIKKYEPYAAGVGGLYVPDTGIVDYIKVTEKYAEIFKTNGGEIKLNARVFKIDKKQKEICLHSEAGDILCKNLVNCAGLYSDRIAKMSGITPGLKIIPFRGEYYKVKEEKHYLVKNLIYPVPNPQFPFLGVHFTRLVRGGVEAGPNAVLAMKREGYKKFDFSCKDSLEMFFYKGFWKMAGKHWRMGLGEIYRSFNKTAFTKALQRLLPGIEKIDLKAGGAGVRAQALEPDGFLVDDFRIKEAPNMVHVLNAPSPAATASINIGKTIATIAARNFDLT